MLQSIRFSDNILVQMYPIACQIIITSDGNVMADHSDDDDGVNDYDGDDSDNDAVDADCDIDYDYHYYY